MRTLFAQSTSLYFKNDNRLKLWSLTVQEASFLDTWTRMLPLEQLVGQLNRWQGGVNRNQKLSSSSRFLYVFALTHQKVPSDMDPYLKAEALSSLFGQKLRLADEVQRDPRDTLSLEDFHFDVITEQQARMRKFFIDEEEFFDPRYDCDYRNLPDSSECWRGGEKYERPVGWYRIALKVKGKYPDGDEWLGSDGWRNYSVRGEWPVSYHGTTLDGAKGIIESHYKAGEREKYGRGIYSTPHLRVAEIEEFARTFTSRTTGRNYKVILQNRINPKERYICPNSDYWLIPVPRGTSRRGEKRIVETSIRPYGILIREV